MEALSNPLIKEATLSLNQAANTYDLFTASGDVLIQNMSVYCTAAAGGALTSVSIQTNQTTPYVFMTTGEGAVGSLLAQANITMAKQATNLKPQIRSGQKIQATIAGGASATGTLKVVVQWYPLPGGNGMLV